MDHAALGEKGYKQTGPLLPLDPLEAGGVAPENLGLYKDLLPFWDRIGGDAVYADAVAHVDHLWGTGVLSTWSDAHTIVEAHDPHPGVVEGLEGAPWDIEDEDHVPLADGGVPPDPEAMVNGQDVDGEGAAAPEAMVDADEGTKVAWAGICCEPRFIEALDTIEEVARHTRDDPLRA